MLLGNLAVLISFTGCRIMVECDVSNCSRLIALFKAPYIPIVKNKNEAKYSSAESTRKSSLSTEWSVTVGMA